MTGKDKRAKIESILAHGGRPQTGPVEPPRSARLDRGVPLAGGVQGGSREFRPARGDALWRVGNPNSHDFESVMSDLEGGYGAVTASSGLAIIACTLMAFAAPDAHFLVTDSVYGPVRRFCDNRLRHLGIEIEYYDPLAGGGVENFSGTIRKSSTWSRPAPRPSRFRMSRPSSGPRKSAALSAWPTTHGATPLFFKPLSRGVDISAPRRHEISRRALGYFSGRRRLRR